MDEIPSNIKMELISELYKNGVTLYPEIEIETPTFYLTHQYPHIKHEYKLVFPMHSRIIYSLVNCEYRVHIDRSLGADELDKFGEEIRQVKIACNVLNTQLRTTPPASPAG